MEATLRHSSSLRSLIKLFHANLRRWRYVITSFPWLLLWCSLSSKPLLMVCLPMAGALYCILSKPHQLSFHDIVPLHVLFLLVTLKGCRGLKLMEIQGNWPNWNFLHVQRSFHSLTWRQARGIFICPYIYLPLINNCMYFFLYTCTHMYWKVQACVTVDYLWKVEWMKYDKVHCTIHHFKFITKHYLKDISLK